MLQCFCGDEKSENHDIGFVATGHIVVKCSKCQASVYVDHVYYYINSEDDPNEHYAECACGQRITERHECNEYVIDDDHTHQIVCKCGKSYTCLNIIMMELIVSHTLDIVNVVHQCV